MSDKTIFQIAIPNEILTWVFRSLKPHESLEIIILNQLRILIIDRETQQPKKDIRKRA